MSTSSFQFNANLTPKPQLQFEREPPEAWILPSKEFIKHATLREKGTVHLLSLGLGETKLKKGRREKLADYREAWHLLTG